MCGSFPGLLIGRTAVHSGKDPAFVAYDQFLSTGILQPLSRGEVRGSFASILPCPLSCPLSPLPDSCSAADRSYSITSSARASSVGGTSRPSVLQVLRWVRARREDRKAWHGHARLRLDFSTSASACCAPVTANLLGSRRPI